MAQQWTVNSDLTLEAFISNARKLYAEHKYLTWAMPRIGADRSMGQNALLHTWITQIVAEKLNISIKDAAKMKGSIEGTKSDLKGMFYRHTGYSWMVHSVKGELSGREKIAYTSSADWGKGEAFEFLTWMQLAAAGIGVILESKGQFNKLQRDQI